MFQQPTAEGALITLTVLFRYANVVDAVEVTGRTGSFERALRDRAREEAAAAASRGRGETLMPDWTATPMKFPSFDMERMQSTWEHRVKYDLSESGVEALTLEEITRDQKELMRSRLGYAEGVGREPTRALIAGFHPGNDAKNVLITTGTSEANFLAMHDARVIRRRGRRRDAELHAGARHRAGPRRARARGVAARKNAAGASISTRSPPR